MCKRETSRHAKEVAKALAERSSNCSGKKFWFDRYVCERNTSPTIFATATRDAFLLFDAGFPDHHVIPGAAPPFASRSPVRIIRMIISVTFSMDDFHPSLRYVSRSVHAVTAYDMRADET